MCGICGLISKGTKETLTSLLLNVEHRGKDATGICYFNSKLKEFSINKCAVPASEFVKLVDKEELSNNSIIIGHTRAATKGSPLNVLNNHPLKSKDTGLILIHNGVIESSVKDLERNKERDGEVDSYEILMEIDKRLFEGKSLIDAIKGACSESITGAYACCIIDPRTPDRVYLFKSINPLFLGLDINCVKFASTRVATGCFWTHEMTDGDLFIINTSLIVERHRFTPKRKMYYQSYLTPYERSHYTSGASSYHYDYLDDDMAFSREPAFEKELIWHERNKQHNEIKKIVNEVINTEEEFLYDDSRFSSIETERKYYKGEVLNVFTFENQLGDAIETRDGQAVVAVSNEKDYRRREAILKSKLKLYL